MLTYKAKLTSKGQITLPKPLRESLSLQEGDLVEFTWEEPDQVRLKRPEKAGPSAGILQHLVTTPAVSIPEMEQNLKAYHQENWQKVDPSAS